MDNNISIKLTRALNALHSPTHQICHLRDKYRADILDVDWLNELANDRERPWIIVSGDLRISRNPVERKMWLDLWHIIFFLSKGWTTIKPDDQFWKLARIFPEIIKEAERAKPPCGFIVPQSSLRLRPIILRS